MSAEALLAARFHDPDDSPWMGHSTIAETCFLCTETATILREQIAKARQQALRAAADDLDDNGRAIGEGGRGPIAAWLRERADAE